LIICDFNFGKLNLKIKSILKLFNQMAELKDNSSLFDNSSSEDNLNYEEDQVQRIQKGFDMLYKKFN